MIVSFPDLCLFSYFGMGFNLLSHPPFGSAHDYKELEVHKNDIRKDYAKCIENYKSNFMENECDYLFHFERKQTIFMAYLNSFANVKK